MMNKTYFTLPDDLGIGLNDTLIYFYSNDRSSVNNKVFFTKNVICLLQKGIKQVHTSEGKTSINNNDVLLLTGGSILMSEAVTEDNMFEAILIFFGNNTLTDFCARHTGTFVQKASDKPILKLCKDDFLSNYCQSIYLLRKEGNSAIDELKVQELLGYLSTQYKDVFQCFVSHALEDCREIKLKQVVESNIYNGLTIEELAFLCNMSISTFKRHFAEVYKMSPQKYFTELKMKKAEFLLFHQNRPSEIFAELGYETLSAFSTEFKKFFGVSPKQFQDKMSC
ncbi:MAG: helix-turn-helix transcriptional regulator [Sporocytophaga sp.]|uniref:helix-turn-helix domain-containing protein n=1 Tax=Sporocytophaga sp. TaxID=2231183 RepID=UPI001B18C2B7|nr:AraC family transcriptional regulator [Sporocytophaga sp.]MBO9703622.1 helix-turn-helix transcriptional regulator [Sporocytophaga sp.]